MEKHKFQILYAEENIFGPKKDVRLLRNNKIHDLCKSLITPKVLKSRSRPKLDMQDNECVQKRK
jgi:hypothetical protein